MITGRNETPDRTWETWSQVVAAERGREVRARGFLLEPEGAGTRLTETWDFLPAGLSMFADKYGDRAADEIEDRTRHAHAGTPVTLAAIRRIAAAG